MCTFHSFGTSLGSFLAGGKILPAEGGLSFWKQPKAFVQSHPDDHIHVQLDQDHTIWGQNKIKPICRVMRPRGFPVQLGKRLEATPREDVRCFMHS